MFRTKPLPARLLRLSAICGCVAPVLFVGLVIVLGMLEPGYNHRTQMMSVFWSFDLGAKSSRVIF